MPPLPSADTVLHREPRSRIVPLPDGRLLLRHPGGSTVLGGVAAADLERLLRLVDGRRTLAAVRRELAAEYAPEGVDDVVGVLLRAGVLRSADEGAPRGGPVAVWDGGTGAGRRVVEALAAAGLAVGEVTGAGMAAAPPYLLLAVAGGARHGDLLAVQRRALAVGVPFLAAVLEPDGARLGPLVPAAGSPPLPCLACAEVARHHSLGLATDELLEALGPVDTLTPRELGEGPFAAALAELVRLAGEVLDGEGDPPLLGAVLHLAAGGEPRTRRVERRADCPFCAAAPASGHPPLTARAEEAVVHAGERSAPVVHPARVAGDAPTVAVVGGGTAGYLAALALRVRRPEVPVTLIESPELPAIGVGEATTPLMPQFLHADLGLDAGDLFAAVEPTLKLGIHFAWGVPHGVFEYPFGPLRLADAVAHDGDVERASLGAMLMAAGRVPAFRGPGEGPVRQRFATAVAYHLDNRRFVAWLRRRARKAGVERVEATIAGVERTGDGAAVAALVAGDGRRFRRDLYLDCSGFRSLLLGGALGSDWVGFGGSLFTDRAVTAVSPLGADAPLPPHTRADTWDAGWAWTIPQRRELHHGYVYASSHLSDDGAAAEVRRRLPAAGAPRHLRFRSGRRRHFVRGNVAALGNAYGFVEPLESTALHLVIRQLGLLLAALPWGRRRGEGWEGGGHVEMLNRRVAGWWDYLAWFLALHYRFNGRLDTPFWRRCRREVDVSAWGELLEVYRRRGPLSADPSLAVLFDAPDPLWGLEGIDLLLLGQEVPGAPPRPVRGESEHRAWLEAAQRLTRRALTQRQLLAAWEEEPELLGRFAAPFRQTGAAFAQAVAPRPASRR